MQEACCSSEDSPSRNDTEARVTREIASMKQALSTASLPQQGSPGCDAQRSNAERPYGSLKKRRGSRQQRTQWRRSWASGSGQSLNNSQNSSLGSLGMDEFYAAVRGNYDYIMDTNLIDTCRDAHGELESSLPLRDSAYDLQVALKPQQWRQPETAARKDIILLRRWLRDVEARLEAHSLSAATRWTRERQQRCLGELADLQLEISAQGRVVGALLRAFTKEEENGDANGDCPRGVRGLERRYHLLYLRALEWQCLLEGLLASSIPSTPSWACSQSDNEEEPLPKHAKLSSDSKRTGSLTDTSDEDDSILLNPTIQVLPAGGGGGSEADVESLDGARVVPSIPLSETSSDMDTDSDYNDNKDFVLTKVTDTVIKRVKNIEISKYNRSNRTADNVATFYFKHRDTDSELDHRSNVALTSSEFDVEESIAALSSESDNEKQDMSATSNERKQEKLANLANGNVQTWQIDNSKDQVDGTPVAENVANDNSEFIVPTVRRNAVRKTQENIRKLVQEAEHLVREDVDRSRLGKHSRSRTFDKTLTPNGRDGNHHNKMSRIKEWLRKSNSPASSPIPGAPLDSCDASGECTSSSDSDNGGGGGCSAESSGEPSGSVATYRRALGDSQCTSTELIDTDSNGPTTVVDISPDNSSSPVKVLLRANRNTSARPWSVSCVTQLAPTSEIKTAEHLQNGIINRGLQKNKIGAQFSHSESALHVLENAVTDQGELNKTDSKFDMRRKRLRLKKRQGRKSESSSDVFGYDISNWQIAEIPKQGNLVKSRSFSGHSQITLEKLFTSPMLKNPKTNKNEKCHGINIPVNFEIGGNITNAPILENIVTSEEHSSSFSEAWDNYQDKYLSESYSECVDTEAARRLLEFGEDYRNYLDSQSDCCSSLSNFATNLDVDNKKFLKNLIANSPDYIKKSIDAYSWGNSDASDMENRKRRTDLHQRRRSSKERRNSKMLSDSDSSKNSVNPKRRNSNGIKTNLVGADYESPKRKSSSKLKLKMRNSTTTDSDSDLDELRRLVTESKIQLDRSEALWCSNGPSSDMDRGVILQPRDYAEIILTCRENIRCLEAVMTRACGAMLTDAQGQSLRGKFTSSTPTNPMLLQPIIGAGINKIWEIGTQLANGHFGSTMNIGTESEGTEFDGGKVGGAKFRSGSSACGAKFDGTKSNGIKSNGTRSDCTKFDGNKFDGNISDGTKFGSTISDTTIVNEVCTCHANIEVRLESKSECIEQKGLNVVLNKSGVDNKTSKKGENKKTIKHVVKRAKIVEGTIKIDKEDTRIKCANCKDSSEQTPLQQINHINVNINKRISGKNRLSKSKKRHTERLTTRKRQAYKFQSDIYGKLCDISKQIKSISKDRCNDKPMHKNIATGTDDDLTLHLNDFFSNLRIRPSPFVFGNVETKDSFINECGELQTTCKCQPIAKFISFLIGYLTKWTNYIKNFILFTFFLRTFRSLLSLIYGIKCQMSDCIKRIIRY